MIKEKIIEQFIRVDHAGEYGAVQIYAGQLKVLGDDQTIKHMHSQEQAHLSFFEEQLRCKKIRPSVLLPVWKLFGYSVGLLGGVFGRKAAMACTIAVEEVIDEHYLAQMKLLQKFNWENSLQDKIDQFRQEELEHRDVGVESQGRELRGYRAISGLVRLGCRTAIILSKHY